MKKSNEYFLLIIIGVLLAFAAQAQQNVVKTNFVHLLKGETGIEYERRLTGNSSMLFLINHQFKYEETASLEFIRSQRLGVDYRYFPNNVLDDAPHNFYFGPTAYIANVNKELRGNFLSELEPKFKTVNHHFVNIGLGLIGGYQFIFKQTFAFDLHVNPVFRKSFIDDSLEEKNYLDDTQLIIERYGLSIGLAF